MKFHSGTRAFEMQDLITLNVNPPVQNTWYTVLDETQRGIILYSMRVNQVNTETDAKTCEVHVVCDDFTPADASQAFVNNTNYCPYIAFGAYDVVLISGVDAHFGNGVPIWCKRIKIQVRITSAPGTNQVLNAFLQRGILT